MLYKCCSKSYLGWLRYFCSMSPPKPSLAFTVLTASCSALLTCIGVFFPLAQPVSPKHIKLKGNRTLECRSKLAFSSSKEALPKWTVSCFVKSVLYGVLWPKWTILKKKKKSRSFPCWKILLVPKGKGRKKRWALGFMLRETLWGFLQILEK